MNMLGNASLKNKAETAQAMQNQRSREAPTAALAIPSVPARVTRSTTLKYGLRLPDQIIGKENDLDSKEYENNSQSNIVVTGEQNTVVSGSVASDNSLVESLENLNDGRNEKIIIVEEAVALEKKDVDDGNDGDMNVKSSGSTDFFDGSNEDNQRKLLQVSGDMEDMKKVVNNLTPSVALITDSSSYFMAENMPLVASGNSLQPEIGAGDEEKSFGEPVEGFKSILAKEFSDDEKSTCLGTVRPEENNSNISSSFYAGDVSKGDEKDDLGRLRQKIWQKFKKMMSLLMC